MITNCENTVKSEVTINSVLLTIHLRGKCFLTLRLYLQKLSVIFREAGNLLQIFGAIYERLFCPRLVLHQDLFNFSRDALVIVLF